MTRSLIGTITPTRGRIALAGRLVGCLGATMLVASAHAAPASLYDPTAGAATVDGAITAAGFSCVAGTGCTPTEYDQRRLFTVGVGGSFGDKIGASNRLYLDSSGDGKLKLGLHKTTDTGCGFGGPDTVVVYIDSKTGGYTSTEGFVDTLDGARRAISGRGQGGEQAVLGFAPGFTADYAISIATDFAGVFELENDGESGQDGVNGRHVYVTTLTQTLSGDGCVRELDLLELTHLGLAPGGSFKYVATFLNQDNAFRSNELQGVAVAPPDHVGHARLDLADGDFNTFHTALPTRALQIRGPGLQSWFVDAFRGTGFGLPAGDPPALAPGLLNATSWMTAGLATNLDFATERTSGVFAKGYSENQGGPTAGSSGLVISQVYGAGGNSGATWRNDFVELFNRGTVPVSLSGKSVQYAAFDGTTWNNKVDLPSAVVPPGRYFLLQLSSGGSGGTVFTGDHTGAINMSGTNGKVALVNSTTALSGCGTTCSSHASVIDFVGFGTADDKEGATAVGALSATTAALRKGGGCTDTNLNGSASGDFTIPNPTPIIRTLATPSNECHTGFWSMKAPVGADTHAGLAIRPGGGTFTGGTAPGDQLFLRAQNTTGTTISGMALKYSVFAFNDNDLSTTFHLAYSVDGTTFTDVPGAAQYATPLLKSGSPAWVETVVDIPSLPDFTNLPPDAYLTLRWNIRDETEMIGWHDALLIERIDFTPSFAPITELAKSVGPVVTGAVSPGDELAFSLLFGVDAASPSGVEDLVFSDTLAGVTAVADHFQLQTTSGGTTTLTTAVDADAGEIVGGVVTVRAGDLPVDALAEVTFRATIDPRPAAGDITNTFDVTYVGEPGATSYTKTSNTTTTAVNASGGTLEILFYFDADGDDTKDADEPGLPGWEALIDQTGEVLTSGADGLMTFTNLAPGSRSLLFAEPDAEGTWHFSEMESVTVLTAQTVRLNVPVTCTCADGFDGDLCTVGHACYAGDCGDGVQADCDDDDVCTDDSCVAALGCQHVDNTADCDDGSATTKDDQCDGAGTCAGTPYTCTPGVCEDTSTPDGVGCTVVYSSIETGCDDGATTTKNDHCDGDGGCAGTPYTCTPTQCQATSVPNGTDCTTTDKPPETPCDDGNPLTEDDQCDGSGGCAGTPVGCTPTQCEESSTPGPEGCVVVYKPPETDCDDGDVTTKDDVCDGSGGCAGTAYTCTPGQCELTSVPDGVGCAVTPKGAGETCNDGDTTTKDDACDGSGGCAGTAYTCTPGQCELTSVPDGVGCAVTPKGAGETCNDGDTTTKDDACDGSGGCAGTAYTCTPGQCELTSVPNGVGCAVTPKGAGEVCNDGQAGTKDDACDGAGACAGTAYTCTPGQCELASVPNGVDCTVTNKGAGETCNDADTTTKDDVCDGAGGCAGTAYTCTPGQCELTSVPDGTGCTVTPKGAGETCDDLDTTTKDDACDGAGTCAGTPYTCTAGPCDLTSVPDGAGCTVTPKGAGETCNDLDTTTKDDVCDGAGACEGTPYTCTPGQCEASSVPNGVDCTVTYEGADTECDDSDTTTKDDACDGAGGCAGTPYTCTAGQCDLTSVPDGAGCVVTPKGAGELCDDGQAGTKDDACDGAGGCAGTTYTCTPGVCQDASTPNGVDCSITFSTVETGCDDGLATTRDDHCDGAGACAGTTYTCTPSQCEASSVPNGVDCTVVNKDPDTGCDDGNAGTRDDVCDGAGTCAGTAYTCTPGQCEASSVPNGVDCTIVNADPDTGCDDGNTGTKDDVCDGAGACAGTAYTCTPSQCEASSVPNGVDCTVVNEDPDTGCDDGNMATKDDVCDGAGTCAGTAYTCTPGQCEASSVPNGTDCTVVNKAADTGCDDGNTGTKDDVCDGAGACAGTAYTCTPSQCEASSVPNGVDCTVVNKAADTGCDDGNTGTKDDVCDGAGACAGTAYTCTPSQCEASSVPNGTDCTVVDKAADTGCDDGNTGTKDDVCDGAGTCAGTAYTCTPTQCEQSSTPNGVGCTVTNKPASASCDDGSTTTKDDVCDGAGTCAGTAYTCTPSACQTSSVPNGVGCTVTNKPANTGCDDGNAGTRDDLCDGAGTCAGTAYTCAPGPCEQSSVPNGVGCTVTNKPPSTACDDGISATRGDVCNAAGACQGTPYSCAPTQCELTSVPDGVGCAATNKPASTACNDGNAATRDDVCDGSGTCAGTAFTCTPTQCELSSVPNGVGCTVTKKPSTAACNDGDLGTRNDVCGTAGLCAGTAYTCTPSQCDESSVPNGVGCTVTHKAASSGCDDGNSATKDDVCNGSGACAGTAYTCTPTQCEQSSTPNGVGCTPTNKPANTGCDDGLAGTRDDVCNGSGVCAGTAYTCTPTQCELSSAPDGVGCTATNKPASTGCDDGDNATKDDVCNGSGVCAGTAYTCTPGPCEETSTSNGVGCTVTYKAADTSCDDGVDATKDDLCDASGTCAGTAYTCTPTQCQSASVPDGQGCVVTDATAGVGCDDGDPCTETDQCDGEGGCAGAPVSCDAGELCVRPDGCTATHCTSCDDDADCGEASACLAVDAGDRCLLACEGDDDCAIGQVCREHADGSMRCFDDEGECAAPPEVADEDPEPGPEPEPEAVEGGDTSDDTGTPDTVDASGEDAAEPVDTGKRNTSSGGCAGGDQPPWLLAATFVLLALARVRRRASGTVDRR